MSIRTAAVREVIVTEHARGKGTMDDPMRTVFTYWSKDGRWLAEYDPLVSKRGDDEAKLL